ncbi:MAG: hypothetical protein AAFR81_11170 [Chloroflexota bacterium]
MEELRKDLREERQDITRFLNSKVRTYYIAVIAASLATWTVAFNFGAYNTVFFRTLFSIWVMCTVIFFATLLLPKHERPLSGGQLAILLIPSLWLLVFLFAPMSTDDNASQIYELITNLLALVTLVTLPVLGYTFLVILQGESLRLPGRMLYAMMAIVLIVALLGYAIGTYHYLFITCQEFTVAGDFAPPNCLQLD